MAEWFDPVLLAKIIVGFVVLAAVVVILHG